MPLSTCFHCGELLLSSPVLFTQIGAEQQPVCCIGCRAAAEWITTLGLQDYYRLRDTTAVRAAAVDDYAVWDRTQLQRLYVRNNSDGSAEISVLVDGMRCAACSWLIEHAFAATEGVREVSINVAARRVRFVWQPDRIQLSAILAALARLGYIPHPLDAQSLNDVAEREQRSALKRLAVAGLGMMQAMMFAIVLYAGALDGIDPLTRDFFRWIGLLVTMPVVFYAAQPFFGGAWRELRARRLGMDTPVALAVALVFAASMFETLRGGTQVYFDSASMFVFLLLGGRYLEMFARHRAADVVDALARLQPAIAQRRNASDELENVGVHELNIGDTIVVADGAAVPVDGAMTSAECAVDESLLSGESRSQRRYRGEQLIAGSVVHDGPVEMRVERIGADTMLSAIVRLVGSAQQQRPRWARYGERIAAYFVSALLLVTLLTATVWLVLDPSRAFAASLAVLVVACPCAFALAVPAALARALAVLAQRGVLVLQSNAIEKLVHANYFVFDKTGTLSQRELELAAIVPLAQLSAADCLALAVQLESGSVHPVAHALCNAATEVSAPHAENIRSIAGAGVEGDIADRHYRLGRAQFALDTGDAADSDDVVLADEYGPLARFALRETLRADAVELIASLRRQGAEIEILSGDSHTRVAEFAARLGIEKFFARVSPQQKLNHLNRLRASGRIVALVGDGVNDAPALAGADIAIALGSGAELAQSSADIVLANDQLSALVQARAIAAMTLRVMRQNIFWALAYNALSVPLAASGFVSPWLAAIGMSTSSLVVVLNSLRINARIGKKSTDAAPTQAHSIPLSVQPA